MRQQILVYCFLVVCLALSCTDGTGMQFGKEPTPDSGGQVVIDTGQNQPPDQRNPVVDQGNPVVDQGNPVVDQGNPVVDQNNTPDPGTTVPDKTVTPEPSTPEPPAPENNTQPEPEPVVPEKPTVPEPVKEAPPVVHKPFSFIAMGDAGTGSTKQKKIAMAIKKKCDAEKSKRPCGFAILLGDNFYDIGVKSATDPQFKTKFSDMYNFLGFPFYITIGNHDYGVAGLGGIGSNYQKAKYYLAYAKTNPVFVLPDRFYAFNKGNTSFVSLNTSEMFFNHDMKKQNAFIKKAVADANTRKSVWKIAFGHHPYISNGTHGNAGNYDVFIKGLPNPIPIVNGSFIKRHFDAEICNKFDFYFSGHDHNRQLLHPKCGIYHVVSGAGAKSKGWGKGKKNAVYFAKDTIGFFFVHVDGRKITIEALDENAKVEFTKVYTK